MRLLPSSTAPRGQIVCLPRRPRGDCDARGCHGSSGAVPCLCRVDRIRAVHLIFFYSFLVLARGPPAAIAALPSQEPTVSGGRSSQRIEPDESSTYTRPGHGRPVPSLSCAAVVHKTKHKDPSACLRRNLEPPPLLIIPFLRRSPTNSAVPRALPRLLSCPTPGTVLYCSARRSLHTVTAKLPTRSSVPRVPSPKSGAPAALAN